MRIYIYLLQNHFNVNRGGCNLITLFRYYIQYYIITLLRYIITCTLCSCVICRVRVEQTGGIFTLTQPVPGVTWRLLGIGNAPEYFTVESNTGIVRIKKPLSEDTSENYYLRVRYYITPVEKSCLI